MNIFNKIGNEIEENKKKKQKFKEKYWKLSACERMDYDQKLIQIKSEEIGFIPKFYLTKLYLGIFLFMAFILFGLYFYHDYDLNKYVNFLRGISLEFLKNLTITISLDFLFQLLGLILDKPSKKKKELNKRFKLE